MLPEDRAGASELKAAVSRALEMAERFAHGQPCSSCESEIRQLEPFRDHAHGDPARQDAIAAIIQAVQAADTAQNAMNIRAEPAERHLLGPAPEAGPLADLDRVAADVATLCGFTAAVDAADALGYSDAFIHQSVADYEKVLSMKLGQYPDAGEPIDPSADGPLGPTGAE